MCVSWKDEKNKADDRRDGRMHVEERRGEERGQVGEEQAMGGDSREWVLRVEQV